MRAVPLLLFWLSIAGLRLLRFMLTSPRLAALALYDRLRSADAQAPDAPVVPPVPGAPLLLCFTGTGELVSSAHSSARQLAALIPGLSGAAIHVFAAPEGRGAYAGARVFADRMWAHVADLVRTQGGPFVLCGMSRGALVALDTGMRIAEEQGKVACVLALSPPLFVPARLPSIVRTLAALERPMEHTEAVLARVPERAQRWAQRRVRRAYLWMSALILRDLRIADGRELGWLAHHVRERDPVAASLLAIREFRMLTEVDAREAQLFARDLAAVAADNPRFFAACLWGERDHWMDARQSRACLDEALAKRPGAAPSVRTALHAGMGHALHRESGAPLAPTLALLSEVVDEALRRQQQHEAAHANASAAEVRSRELGP